MKGRTNTGFEIEIDDVRVDDIRVIDAIVDVEDGNIGGISRLIRLLFTPEQISSFYAHLKKEYGALKIEDVSREVFEILNGDTETKN